MGMQELGNVVRLASILRCGLVGLVLFRFGERLYVLLNSFFSKGGGVKGVSISRKCYEIL